MKNILAIGGAALFAFAPIAVRADSSTSTATPAWPSSSVVVRPAKLDGVPNFGKLNSNVWRSGQPTREGYQSLAADGLKTVVNLREEFPGDKDLLPQGVKYVYIPIKDDHAPTDEQAKQFIDTVSNPANWPLLVHCKAGEGRAGTMAAIVRHSFDGWDHDRIIEEATNFHKGTSLGSRQQQFLKHWEDTPAATVQATALAAAPETPAPVQTKP